jgi:hypothetical protein
MKEGDLVILHNKLNPSNSRVGVIIHMHRFAFHKGVTKCCDVLFAGEEGKRACFISNLELLS